MTDRQELWLLLVVLYLAECFRWVRRGSVVFRRWPGVKSWQRRDASEFIGNDHGDLHWTIPWPPFGDFVVARGFPWSIGPEGVATWHPAAPHPNGRCLQPATFLRWSECQRVELEGDKIFVAGQRLWQADSPVEAERLGQWLKQCAELSPDQRSKFLRKTLADSFDVDSVKMKIAKAEIVLRKLRPTGWLIWVLMLVILPVSVWRQGWVPALPVGIPILYLLCFWNAWQVSRAHQTWYPYATTERTRLRWLSALSPMTSVRAAEMLGRNRIETFDPLAVSLALQLGESRDATVAFWCRDAHHARCPENPFPNGTAAAKTVDGFAVAYREAGLHAIREAGFDGEKLLEPPAASETVHTQYCARCRTQFTAAAERCQACGGRPLVPLRVENRGIESK